MRCARAASMTQIVEAAPGASKSARAAHQTVPCMTYGPNPRPNAAARRQPAGQGQLVAPWSCSTASSRSKTAKSPIKRRNAAVAKKGRGTRRTSGGFVMVLNPMMKSAAWLDLSGTAVKLLLHLMMLSKGNNGWGHGDGGGHLFLSERDAAAAIGVARNTASRAFEELISHGFLRTVRAGHFHVKVRLATIWR